MRTTPSHLLLSFALLASLTAARAQDYALDYGPLMVDGKITDGENKLPGGEVVVYKDNEQIATIITDKGGKFHTELLINADYAIEFRHEGFVAKRIAIDTHMPKPKAEQEFELVPIVMNVSMLERSRYQGANTDDLDFPFAMIKFNKKTFVFEQDMDYTMGMQRTNGALLLMAARADMKK